MWRDAGYVDALSSVRRCVLLDHRGHGRSEQPPLAQAHTMERYAADVVDVLDDLAIERTAFWGYSQGGEIGLALAGSPSKSDRGPDLHRGHQQSGPQGQLSRGHGRNPRHPTWGLGRILGPRRIELDAGLVPAPGAGDESGNVGPLV